ncbi:hypothetical protein [Serratia nevei]
MNEKRQHHAYQRGVRMANLWKRLKGTILKWDAICVAKARRYKLPGWIGHIPMVLLTISILVALVFGGAIIATSAVLMVAVILLASPSKAQHSGFRQSSDSDERIYHDWDHDRFNGREYHPHRYNGWKDDD